MNSAFAITDVLWRNGLAAIPLAVLVAVLCRVFRSRPATRHTLWLIVLLWFVVAPLLPAFDLAGWAGEFLTVPAAKRVSLAPAATTIDQPPSISDERPVETPETAEIPLDPNDFLVTVDRQSAGVAVSLNHTHADLDCAPHAHDASAPATASPTSARLESIVMALPVEAESPISSQQPEAFPSPGTLATDSALDGLSGAVNPAGLNLASDSVHPRVPPAVSGDGSENRERLWLVSDESWRGWVFGLGAVRDAVVRMPAIPRSIWLGGLVSLFACCAAAVLRTRRRLRHSVPAPSTVIRTVTEIANAYGLKRIPRTIMVDDCISPMVTCGRCPRLILPIGLWAQLDAAGRRAILCHELAHLRRRDHWIRWGQLVVLALYWWHPVAWWVRRKLSEEAELCCDAWVTWLMPKGRRAYAQALLKTKQYLSQHRAVPVVGIGVTSPHAKRFARRIKMVMTERVRPGLSLSGIVLALMLATAGWLVAPVWACPPEESSAKAEKKGHKHAHAVPAVAPVPAVEAISAVEAGDEDTFMQHVARRAPSAQAAPPTVVWRGSGGGRRSPDAPAAQAGEGGRGLEERLERLERQLERVTKRLEELNTERGRPGQMLMPTQPAPPTRPGAVGRGVGSGAFNLIAPQANPGEEVVRTYKVSEGKLDALFELMKRDDVPIRVRKLDNAIEVHANEGQQAQFRAFLQMIDPRDDRGSSALDTPYGAALAMIEAHQAEAANSAAVAQARRMAELEVASAQARIAGDLAGARSIRAVAMVEQVARLVEQAARLRAHADELRVRANELRDRANELREKADNGDDDSSHALEAEAEAVERQAEEVEHQAEHVEEHAEAVREQAEELESQSDEEPGTAR